MNVFEASISGTDARVTFGLKDGVRLEYQAADFSRAVRDALMKRQNVVLGIRPYSVRRSADGVTGRVAVNQWLGDQTHIAADFAGGTMVLVEHDRTSLEIGQPIGIRLDPASLHVFDSESGMAIRTARSSPDARHPHRHRCRDVRHQVGAFDLGGRQLAMTAVPNSYEAVGRTGSVQELRRTWTDTVKTLVELSARIENLPGRVAAIAVTGQGDGTWMIDREGEPVGKGWLWLDARASAIVERLRAESGDAERFSRTGSGLAACQQGPQLRWMKDHAPEMLQGAATAFHCKDWLYFNLTDKRATDPSEANFTFGDFRKRQYSDEVIDFLGLNNSSTCCRKSSTGRARITLSRPPPRLPRACRRGRRWCSAMSTSSARRSARAFTIPEPTRAARS